MRDDQCRTCASTDVVTLTSDIYASARGIEAPPLYDAADRGLSVALLGEMMLLFLAAGVGSRFFAMAVLCAMMGTAGMLAWGLPAMRQRHRLRMIMRARARALPASRYRPELPASAHAAVGVARRLKKTVRGPLSGYPCLAAAVDVIVRDKLAFREVRSEDFLVVAEDGTSTIVTGVLWFEPGPSDLSMHTAEAELQVDAESILPARFRPGGTAHETRIEDGNHVVVRGRPTMEQHPDMITSYRDPDVVVVRGETGSPVSITKEPVLHFEVY